MKRLNLALFLVLMLIFMLACPAAAQILQPYPKFKAFDSNGNPLSGGKVYTFAPGTTTPKATYADYGLATPQANPVILDSNGEATIYLSGRTKFVLKTAADVTIWTLDNVGKGQLYTILPLGTLGTQAAIEAAIAAIGATERTLYLAPATWSITDDLTIPANINLRVERGAILDIAHTKTLTINGSVDAGPYQIFSCTGTGAITLGKNAANPVLAEWFGISGDGSDVTSELAQLFAACRANGLPIRFPTGGRIVSNHTSTLNLSGIPRLMGTDVEFDFSEATAKFHMKVQGSKTELLAAQTVSAGQAKFTVGGSFEPGDVILIASNEATPNTKRAYYRKGSRHYVTRYTGGIMTVMPASPFSYTASAYIFKLTEKKIRIDEGITFKAVNGSSANGLYCKYANADIRATFKNFGARAIMFGTSQGKFSGKIINSYYIGTGNSYGVSVADLSEVFINNAHIFRCRHAVAVGGGLWNDRDVGGSGGSAIALPDTFIINGGYYFPSSSEDGGVELAAIDAHGCAMNLTVTGATIYGGIAPCAHTNTITGNTIYHRNYNVIKYGDNNSTEWGTVLFANNNVHLIGNPTNVAPATKGVFSFSSSKALRKLIIDGNTFDLTGADSVAANMGFGSIISSIKFMQITNNLFFSGDQGGTPYSRYLNIYVYKELSMSNNNFRHVNINLYPKNTSGVKVKFNNNVSHYSYDFGVRFVANRGNVFDLVEFDKDRICNAWRAGIYVDEFAVKQLKVRGLTCMNNNRKGSADATGAGITIVGMSGITSLLELYQCDFSDDQASPTQYQPVNVLGDADIAFVPGDVDTGNDKITTTDDLITGTVVTVSTDNTLPAPLAGNTLYYIIYVDATHVKLAASLANALAGTPIDLTNGGVGSHCINCQPTLRWSDVNGDRCLAEITASNFRVESQRGIKNISGGTVFPDAVLATDGNLYKYTGAAWGAFSSKK